MAKYKLIGQRYLRKYTADKTSPTYAATIDAQTVVDSLCDVKWKKVSATDATMTYHTDENVSTDNNPMTGLDMNVVIRDKFDAALFCAGHTGGQHRAYANAAVYHYVFPNGTLPKLMKLTAKVTSDPYNSMGARIAILTNATGEIPTNCNICRTGDAHADGIAPRTVDETTGNWFPTMADCVFSTTPETGETALPTGGLQLQKHFFVFVLMESYSTVRGNWLEGCSFIKNLITIETDGDISEWVDGDTIDLTTKDSDAFKIVKDAVLPCIPVDALIGERHLCVRTDANFVVEEDGSQMPFRQAYSDAAAASVGRLYSAFYDGKGDLPVAKTSVAASGAAFNVTRAIEKHVVPGFGDNPQAIEVIRIDSSALVVPFVSPCDFFPARIVLTFGALELPDGARFNVFVADSYLTSLTNNQLIDPGLYTGDGGPFRLLGVIDGGTSATFEMTETLGRTGSIVITGWFPPEKYNLTTGGQQGTGSVAFFPDITILE